ncbi:phosphate-sensing transcription factor PHO4 [Aspergillus saccharolyticus JOP 1030-1]|uniref:HLH transcription factor n=1 Tax=Aspergillus saccharolyticus JOP 1030-1 TaxID=1450539 RepID=A0A318Z6P9_9EURO|nr:HLH transcription factor [Aspergillus saccharolyticus JOP 1030-1]PYH42779.1 HLH transcription factor [Aspergillus saccharolyticus JOP 1030-1]
MDQGHSLSWSDIPPSNDDEFTNFLEFGMQFPDVDGHPQPDHHAPRPLTHAVTMSMPVSAAPAQEQLTNLDTNSISAPASSYSPMIDNGFALDLVHHGQEGQPHGSSYSTAPVTPAFYAPKPPIYHHQQHPPVADQSHSLSQPTQSVPQSFVPQGRPVIPPTPDSIEFHGTAATYPQRVDGTREVYEPFGRANDEQALYTPLVSPAMTPLESQFRLPEYTIPGEYFTPLTSPALEAQHTNSTNYPFHSSQVSEMGFVPSPAEHSLTMSTNVSSPGVMRKHRRQPSSTKSFSARAKKQQSPSVRPQTRKKSLMSLNPDEVFSSLSQDQAVHLPQTPGGSGLRYASNESSGQDSVSPEPLSEPLMPPPALPPSRRSPAIRPQPARPPEPSEPATPAMLMRIQRSPLSISQTVPPSNLTVSETQDDVMEDVILPEAATSLAPFARPQLTRIETTVQANTVSSATSGNINPALEPKSAKRNTSLAPSPRSIAMPSPSGPLPKKSDTPKLGPLGRKRQSMSSSQASPSLRPKISPSIQPLVRGDAMSSETSALYLASKSNYQHILDGTLLPGVSYPETLAENLSSKRTNHKLAEQGRRNRINNALKEIETLIPASFIQMKHPKEVAVCPMKGADKEKEKANSQPISKASTVEMAIDYIKSLQQELEETKGRLAAAESLLGNSKPESNQDNALAGAENGPKVQSAVES